MIIYKAQTYGFLGKHHSEESKQKMRQPRGRTLR